MSKRTNNFGDGLSAAKTNNIGLNVYKALGLEGEESTEILPLPVSKQTQQDQSGDEANTIAGFQSDQVQEAARTSLDFLAALVMPQAFKYLFPKEYIAAWQWLLTYVHKTRDFSQLALGLPRGFSKTTLVKLFIVYTILFTKKKFIAICCETERKSVNMVADIMKMLEQSNVVKVFGNWRLGIEIDQQAQKVFGYRGRTIIIIAGTVETIRGINMDNARPDVMIFDDIQSRTDADSQVVSETLEREMIGTAMKAKSPEGCLFIFVANMYPTKYSILRHLKTNPNWLKFIVGGILKDGTSLWEELQPIAQLHKEFTNDLLTGHPEVFYAEVLNDENATQNNTIDLTKVPKYPFQDSDIPAGKFIIVDPAGDKVVSDAVSIGYFEVHNGFPVLRKVLEGRFSPGDIIRESLKMCFKYNVRLVVYEAQAFQYSLLYWHNFICLQMGIIGIEPVDLYSGASAKNSRILLMFLQLLRGELFIHPDAQDAAHFQITQFNPMVRTNTDGILDLLTYATKALEIYSVQIASSNIYEEQDFGGVGVVEDNYFF